MSIFCYAFGMKALPHDSIKRRYEKLAPSLTEKSRRLWAASEAEELGYGGVSAVSRATGLTPRTINHGIEELVQGVQENKDMQRKPGGGRKPLTEKYPSLISAIEDLVEPYTSGDPAGPLRWTCKSTAALSNELKNQGFPISPSSVGDLLKKIGFSLQGSRRRFEGRQHPDRNLQFEYIASAAEEFQSRGCPAVSVDAKKRNWLEIMQMRDASGIKTATL